MNKKIKLIELYNKVANKDLPKQIRWEDMIWTLDEGRDYISETGRTLGSDVRLDELNDYVEILEDNIEQIEQLDAYKLMESPYMTNLLKEQRYDTFMELLKQSEVEIADKLIKLTWAVEEIRKDLNK